MYTSQTGIYHASESNVTYVDRLLADKNDKYQYK
jgi:hypothetical protein